MKYFLLIFVFLQVTFLPTMAFAGTCVPPQIADMDGICFTPANAGVNTPATYTLMAPLTGLLGVGGSPDLTTYLTGVVQIVIGVAGILAVIMMVYCGIKLMGTPSASGRTEAKECIWNAIFGVLLAVGAWVLLNTINPLLLTNELSLGDVQVAPAAVPPSGPATDPDPTKPGWYFKYSDSTGTHYNPAGNSAAVCAELLDEAVRAGKTVIDTNGQKCFEVTNVPLSALESAARSTLCGNISCIGATPIAINTSACPNIGATGCTNVGGLGSAAVNAIKALPGACGCNIIISGGTEYWLHGKTRSTTPPPPGANYLHAPGNDVFDLKKNTKLDALIKAPSNTKKSSFVNFRWLYNGFWYTEEGDHWHVCRDGLSASYCRS